MNHFGKFRQKHNGKNLKISFQISRYFSYRVFLVPLGLPMDLELEQTYWTLAFVCFSFFFSFFIFFVSGYAC